MNAPPLPRLRATTRRLDGPRDLLALADSRDPLVWLRGGRGMVGSGVAWRAEFLGADRLRAASSAWRQLAALSVGEGLRAFGTFAFAAASSVPSVLLVPERIVGSDEAGWFETRVSSIDEAGESSEALETQTAAPKADAWTGISFAARRGADASYLEGAARVLEMINVRSVDKVVVSRQLVSEIDADADLRVPLSRLSVSQPECWVFAVDGMLGASPETLVQSAHGAVSARVLAGTRSRYLHDRARDERERDELVGSAKEQREHAFAVQSVVTALAPHVSALDAPAPPIALGLPNVWHLATDVSASLADASSSLDLVEALHPTAAVAGTPTVRAIEAIEDLEPFDRGRYAGAVGWIDAAGDGEWAIALRCAQVSEPSDAGRRTVVASAGGGIVAGSDPQHELEETRAKFRPILDAFA